MKTTQSFNSKLLSFFSILLLVFTISCGSDDDDGDTNITIAEPQQQQRQEGEVDTGRTVIINKYNLNLRVINKTIVVTNNVINFNFRVNNLHNVVHQHIIYVANSCNAIRSDSNRDGVVDRREVEQAVGGPVATLNEAQGSNYSVQQSLPESSFPSQNEHFILVIYGAEEDADAPVGCFTFSPKIIAGGSTGTTGTTGGTGSTGSTGGGPTACIPANQLQNIRTLMNNFSERRNFAGPLNFDVKANPFGRTPGTFQGNGTLNVSQSATDSWSVVGQFFGSTTAEVIDINYAFRILPDGCLYKGNEKVEIVSASPSRLVLVTTTPQGERIEESYSSVSGLRINQAHEINNNTFQTLDFNLLHTPDL